MLLLWAVTFVEAWRIKERALAVKWGITNVNNGVLPSSLCIGLVVDLTTNLFAAMEVETLRAEYDPKGDIWWKRELKLIASIPIIALFAVGLSVLITFIFVFEAFVGQLYAGPGHQHIVRPSCLSPASCRLNPVDSFLGSRSNDPLHPNHPSLSFILPKLCQTSHKLGEPCNS